MKKYLVVFLFFLAVKSYAVDITGVYPTHWWVGMKNPKLQLMVHGEGIGGFTKFTSNNPTVKIEKINKVENKNYVLSVLLLSREHLKSTCLVEEWELRICFMN